MELSNRIISIERCHRGSHNQLTPRHFAFSKERIMSHGIEGKVVVITGASSGLGEATARLLSSMGAALVLGARRLDRLDKIARELRAEGGKVEVLATDVTRRADVEALVALAVERFGKAD